jgi:hypothetical protein
MILMLSVFDSNVFEPVCFTFYSTLTEAEHSLYINTHLQIKAMECCMCFNECQGVNFRSVLVQKL